MKHLLAAAGPRLRARRGARGHDARLRRLIFGKKSGSQTTVHAGRRPHARHLHLPGQRSRAGHRGGHRAAGRTGHVQVSYRQRGTDDVTARCWTSVSRSAGESRQLALAGRERAAGIPAARPSTCRAYGSPESQRRSSCARRRRPAAGSPPCRAASCAANAKATARRRARPGARGRAVRASSARRPAARLRLARDCGRHARSSPASARRQQPRRRRPRRRGGRELEQPAAGGRGARLLAEIAQLDTARPCRSRS